MPKLGRKAMAKNLETGGKNLTQGQSRFVLGNNRAWVSRDERVGAKARGGSRHGTWWYLELPVAVVKTKRALSVFPL